jgi:hypothetical protein
VDDEAAMDTSTYTKKNFMARFAKFEVTLVAPQLHVLSAWRTC